MQFLANVNPIHMSVNYTNLRLSMQIFHCEATLASNSGASSRLDSCLVAVLFAQRPGLSPLTQAEMKMVAHLYGPNLVVIIDHNSVWQLFILLCASQDYAQLEPEDAESTREERAFRLWLNSLQLQDQHGQPVMFDNLFTDCRDGLLLLRYVYLNACVNTCVCTKAMMNQ